jgi:hypothetical protein
MRICFIPIALSCLFLIACASPEPTVQTGSDAEVIAGNLHRVDNSWAASAFKDPDADFSKYNSVMLDPLNMDNVEIVQPRGSSATSRNTWELTDSDRQTLQKQYREVFTRELQETGDYTVTDTAAADVLRISAALTGIAPAAARDDSRSRPTGRTRVYTEGAGSMAIGFVFSDSTSSKTLAVVKDSRSGTPMWGSNNRVTNMSDVRTIFGHWARAIRARLDIMHGF